MKIYPISNFNKLRPYNNDFLPGQKQKRPKPVEIDAKINKIWEINDILQSRRK